MAEHTMTDEVRKLLLSKMPFSISSTIEYTPPTYTNKKKDAEGNDTAEYEIPEDYRPAFTVRPFSKGEADNLRKVTANKTPDEAVLKSNTRKAVVGWRNMWDIGTMTELEYKADINGGLDKDLFDSIPLQVVTELFLYISTVSGILPAERLGL